MKADQKIRRKFPAIKGRSFEERFWEKVDRRGPDECWLWMAAADKHGYGRIGRGRRDESRILAHRAAYELVVGIIPLGLLVCHACDTPACVNPAHLFIGTYSDNMKDCASKGRCVSPRGETHRSAKLTDGKALEILLSKGTHRAIASKFGITHSVVGLIKRRKIWKHI